MGLFGKKKIGKQDMVLMNKEMIGKNAADMSVLISKLPQTNQAVIKQFQGIQDELKYLSPSSNKDVHNIDQTIHQHIDDCKIEVSKHGRETHPEAFQSQIDSLKTLIILRNEESKRFKK